MNNSFLSKVTAERRVLAIVNAKFEGVRQLAGLSNAAIMHWRTKVATSGTDRLVDVLVKLGGICQSLSNRSNESFEFLSSDVEGALEAAMKELRASISEVVRFSD